LALFSCRFTAAHPAHAAYPSFGVAGHHMASSIHHALLHKRQISATLLTTAAMAVLASVTPSRRAGDEPVPPAGYPLTVPISDENSATGKPSRSLTTAPMYYLVPQNVRVDFDKRTGQIHQEERRQCCKTKIIHPNTGITSRAGVRNPQNLELTRTVFKCGRIFSRTLSICI
jgi:hypothetical protein